MPQKVGVVLSGGGPRGVTHIGVLKALEENNIPIDYITGTSMGAIIGGLYASGYSPDEIEKMIRSNELAKWITKGTDPDISYFFKQPPPNASWQIFKITYDSVFKAKLPTNIVSPDKLDFGFLELYSGASVASEYNFDSLYVPFRCVAADIVSNEAVVLKDGQLEKAIRASMTFPFYFKPVRINNRLMFDGGMYNNFPVDVMLSEFDADVIIGSKAASNYDPPQDDDVISQVQSMLMANTNYTVNPDSGILIEPELWSVRITDFSNTAQFIDSGYVSTMRKMENIKKFVKRQETPYLKNKKREEFKLKTPPFIINDIQYTGISKERKIYLDKLIRKNKSLESINNAQLSLNQKLDIIKSWYYQLLAEEKIKEVYPELLFQDGQFDVIFNITPSTVLEVDIGGLLSSRSINEIFIQLQYNRWRKSALNLTGNAYFGRFHNSGHLHARYDIPGSFPLGFILGYTLNGWNYFNTTTYFFEDENPSFLIQQNNYWSFAVGTPLSRTTRLSLQYESGRNKDEYYQTNQFSRLDTTDVTFFDFYSPGVVMESNTLNRKQYASKGTYLKLCGRFISGLENNIPGSTSVDTNKVTKYHDRFLLRFLYDGYITLSRAADLGIYGQVAISTEDPFNNYTSTVLSAPSFEPLPETQTIFLPQFRAHSFGALGLKMVFHPFRNFDLRAEGYIFQPYKEILKTEDNKVKYGDPFAKRYFILSGRVVYHAPFGPVSISADYYDQAEDNFIFNINIGYYIFNQRPFN